MRNYYDPDDFDARTDGGPVPGDVEFYTALAQEAHAAGHPVLEVACGTGRVAIPVARAGVRVVGLDLSPAMLARASEKSAGLDNVRWVEGDMRDFALPERFGLIFIPFRSFQHLLTVAGQLACLGRIREHLVPGGRPAINVFNPNIVAIGQWLSVRRGSLQRRREPYTAASGRQAIGWEAPSYRLASQELEVAIVDEELNDDGAVISRIYRELKLRYVFRFEMEHLFARAGFEIEALYGDHFRSPFESTSPEMVWLVRRP